MVDSIIGDADYPMVAIYRKRIDDDWLRPETDHVHRWLWPAKQKHKKAK